MRLNIKIIFGWNIGQVKNVYDLCIGTLYGPNKETCPVCRVSQKCRVMPKHLLLVKISVCVYLTNLNMILWKFWPFRFWTVVRGFNSSLAPFVQRTSKDKRMFFSYQERTGVICSMFSYVGLVFWLKTIFSILEFWNVINHDYIVYRPLIFRYWSIKRF